MAESKSRVLVIGATGYVGKHVARASVRLGHPTFILVRSTTSTDPAKAQLLQSLEDSGITRLEGDLNDYGSLVSALGQVDVVVSTVGGAAIADQVKIIQAAKEVGTIKRFFPSEFGLDVDRLELEFKVSELMFGPKVSIRREVEKSGIPYTFVASGGFLGYFLRCRHLKLGNLGDTSPPEVEIWGDGNVKAVLNDEDDIGTFTIKAVDDPRTENKVLHIRPKENFATQNEIIRIWEEKTGKTVEKKFVSKEKMVQVIQESPFPSNIGDAIRYSIFVKGEFTNFELGPKDVEATELYPDVNYTTLSDILERLV